MSEVKGARSKQIAVRFSEVEYETLWELCRHYSLSAGSLVRMLVKRDADVSLRGKK